MNTFSLKSVFREAFEKIEGTKSIFLLTFLALALTQLIVWNIEVYLKARYPHPFWVGLFAALLLFLMCTPILAGLYMYGVRRARGESIALNQGFGYFKKTGPLFLTQLMFAVTLWILDFFLSFSIAFLSEVFFKSLSVYIELGVSFVFAFLLVPFFIFGLLNVVDQNLSPKKAYLQSIKIVFPNMKKIIPALLFCLLLNILGAILFGIGLLWSIPFSFIVVGILYQKLFLFSGGSMRD